MGNTRITLEVDGKPEFDRVFKRVDANFSDLMPVWEEVKLEFWEIEKEQFQSGGAAGASGKWKPLAKATEAAKIAKYGTFALIAGPMIATEALYKSLTRETGDSVVEIDKDGIAIGTSLPYAKHHQRGAGRLPQRKLIDFSEPQKTGMMKRIQKKMIELMRKDDIPVSGITILD